VRITRKVNTDLCVELGGCEGLPPHRVRRLCRTRGDRREPGGHLAPGEGTERAPGQPVVMVYGWKWAPILMLVLQARLSNPG